MISRSEMDQHTLTLILFINSDDTSEVGLSTFNDSYRKYFLSEGRQLVW